MAATNTTTMALTLDRQALIDWYTRNRQRSKALFDLVVDEAYYARPISLRHPLVFGAGGGGGGRGSGGLDGPAVHVLGQLLGLAKAVPLLDHEPLEQNSEDCRWWASMGISLRLPAMAGQKLWPGWPGFLPIDHGVCLHALYPSG